METPDIPVKLIKNRFVLQEDLGQGGYGSVCKAVDKLTNEVVAIKFNKKLKNFKIECAVMEHLNKFKFMGKKFSINTF
jgi:serine/threonine protein kinase